MDWEGVSEAHRTWSHKWKTLLLATDIDATWSDHLLEEVVEFRNALEDAEEVLSAKEAESDDFGIRDQYCARLNALASIRSSLQSLLEGFQILRGLTIRREVLNQKIAVVNEVDWLVTKLRELLDLRPKS